MYVYVSRLVYVYCKTKHYKKIFNYKKQNFKKDDAI